MAKVNISLPDGLLEKIDVYAEQTFTTRSGLIAQSVNQFLLQQEAISLLRQMSFTMKKIADKGEIDPEIQEELEDFQRFASVVISGKNP